MKPIEIDLHRILDLGKEDSQHLDIDQAKQFKLLKLSEEMGEFAQCVLKYFNAPNASKSAIGDDMLEEWIDVIIVIFDISLYASSNGVKYLNSIFKDCWEDDFTMTECDFNFIYRYFNDINYSMSENGIDSHDVIFKSFFLLDAICLLFPDKNRDEIIKRKLRKWESKVEAKRLLDSK